MKHFIFLSFLFFNHLLSQNLLNNQDAKDILKQTGLTKNQAKTILQKEGIKVPNDKKATSFDNSQFLKEEQVSDDIIRDIELINEQNKSIVDELDQGDMDDKEKINIDDIDNNSLNIIEEDILFDEIIEPTYFGYDVFENDPEIFQESLDNNIDPNYVVGPGDEIIIMLWGETELNQPFIISREGYLFIPNIGQVFVNGLTLAKLEVKLFKLLKKVYSSLESKTGQVSTFFDISLGALVLRPLRIFALGEIEQPGAYSVKPSTTLFTSLYFFNGPTIEGSLRTIKLIRSEKEVGAIDFYDFLLTGKKTNDIQLQRDDVVFIPPRGKTVTVRGEINRQAIYELKDNEGLKSLIEISGGLKTTTYMDRVQIDRILTPLDRKSFRMDRTIVDVRLNDILDSKKDFPLLDGDEITFFKISDVRLNTVTLYGAVQRPGIYGLGTGMKLKDLINKSDGLSGDAYLDEAIIYRKYIDLTEEHIRVNLKEVLAGDALNNISLLSNDEVTIYSTTDMRFTNDLTITGHVMYPGVKPFRKGMTVYDLIFLGGGFENEEHMKNTYVDRADLIRFNDNDFSKTMQSFRLDSVLAGRGLSNFDLKMGDEIIIYTKKDILGYFDQIVYADGFVKNPGEFQLYENMRVLDLLFLAGGVEDDAHFKNIYFDRADLVRNDNNLDVKIPLETLINRPDFGPWPNSSNSLLAIGQTIDIIPDFEDIDNSGTFERDIVRSTILFK